MAAIGLLGGCGGLSWPRALKKTSLLQAPLFAAIVLFLNAPQFLRTAHYCGSPFGCKSADDHGVWKFANEHITIPGTVSNVVRNGALHLVTPVVAANEQIEKGCRRLLTALNINPDDPATTWTGATFKLPPFEMSEDTTGDLLHLLLIAGTILGMVVSRKARDRRTAALATGLIAGLFNFLRLPAVAAVAYAITSTYVCSMVGGHRIRIAAYCGLERRRALWICAAYFRVTCPLGADAPPASVAWQQYF